MGSAKWWGVTDWYIDPAGTSGGSDENSGLTSSAPIKSIAEWRRRVRGAHFESSVTIHVLSSSTIVDDGMFYGFSTALFSVFVNVIAVPTVVTSGTLSAYQAYSGNTRGSVTDSGITSWTASNAISTTSGSRFIRKTGSGARHYAPLLKDMGSKTAQMGVVCDWDDTNTTTVVTAETNFAVSDTYEVVSFPTWPAIQAFGCNVRAQCLDILATEVSGAKVTHSTSQITYVLCGFITQHTLIVVPTAHVYSCVSVHTSGVFFQGGNISSFNCCWVNCPLEWTYTGFNWNGMVNVFVNAPVRVYHSSMAGSLGTIRSYDNTTTCLDLQHMSRARVESIVGSGNTGKLITSAEGSLAYGGVTATATTTDPVPFNAGGSVSASTPVVNSTTGDAIYS